MYTAENQTIQGLINAFLIVIPLGGAWRIGQCAFTMIYEEEKRGEYKRRAINAAIFVVVAELAVVIVNLIYQYFG